MMSSCISVLLPLMCISSLSSTVRGQDYYSSMWHLKQAAGATGEFLHYLEWYTSQEQLRINKLLRLASELGSNMPDRTTVEHPVGAYKFIERMHHMSELIDNTITCQMFDSMLKARNIPVLGLGDKIGAAQALLRLQRAYNRTTEDLAEGNVSGNYPIYSLNAADMEFLGQSALQINDVGLAESWFRRTMRETTDNAKKSQLLTQMATAHAAVGDFTSAVIVTKEATILDPTNQTVPVVLQGYQAQETAYQHLNTHSVKTFRPVSELKLSYEKLCREDHVVNPKTHRHLYCYYRGTAIPIYKVKEEVINIDPRISLFYDVISDSDIDLFIKLTGDQLQRALVGANMSHPEITEGRVSKTAWLWDFTTERIKQLSESVELYSGLSTDYYTTMSHSEPFQIVNYGLGGQYEPHNDYYDDPAMLANVPEHLKYTGDRIATFMLYLNDVTEGGNTVFPYINVRVPPYGPPRKGTAVLWYNTKKSGKCDQRVQHGGCPVLRGEKWVTNKWIRERGQEFRRQCGLTEHENDPKFF